MSSRPLIGVTGPRRGGFTAWLMTALAIYRAGGKPLRITPQMEFDESALQGLVIGGGTDVDPLHYGEEPAEDPPSRRSSSALDWVVGILVSAFRLLFARHEPELYDPERDELEQHLIRHALYHQLPLLGICRGAQLLNVTLGGSLHQRIDHFYAEGSGNVRSVLPSKEIELTEGSRLSEVLGVRQTSVNALHEQCIREPGDGIIISAREQPSGIVQAIERQGAEFILGVQWHPEYLPQYRTQQALFHSLVDRAAARH